MDDNARLANPRDARAVTREAMVQSALLSAAARRGDRPRHAIASFCRRKVSAVQDLDRGLSRSRARAPTTRCISGSTEAGMGSKGIVASSAAMSVLLQEGIGDTIRVSLTPGARRRSHAGGEGRAGIAANDGLPHFVPLVAACPGCGRTTSTRFQELAREIQGFIRGDRCRTGRRRYPGVEALNVAVMGCIVNGPGESKHADIGISLPGTGRNAGRAGVRRRQEGRDCCAAKHWPRISRPW